LSQGVAKIFTGFRVDDRIRWKHGTGSVHRKSGYLVTAAHCVFLKPDSKSSTSEIRGRKWFGSLQPADFLKVYIGYRGKSSVPDTDGEVAFRYGTCVAVQKEYIEPGPGKSHKTYDVAVVKLSSPFTDANPIKYVGTPDTGTMHLGVVGYPRDKEEGERMYMQFEDDQQFDLRKSEFNMLRYGISTFRGMSSNDLITCDPKHTNPV
jgi:hypothetical protein